LGVFCLGGETLFTGLRLVKTCLSGTIFVIQACC
jgi:hypothetical protein